MTRGRQHRIRWRFKATRHPLPVDFIDDYTYDSAEDVFRDRDGQRMAVNQMLHRVYVSHCRTYGRAFSWRWRAGTLLRRVPQVLIWRGQDLCLWLLLQLYDIELVGERDLRLRSPFHKYGRADFRRAADAPGRSHFFGFEVTPKSLFANLGILAITFLIGYWWAPRTALLRTIYNNTALSTAALVLAFLIVDKAAPLLLVAAICGLSRLRPSVMFIMRKVRV